MGRGWVRSSGHPGHQILHQCLLIPGAASALGCVDGAPKGRWGLCVEVTDANISKDTGGKGERGPAIPVGPFPRTNHAGEHQEGRAASSLIHSRNCPPQMPKVPFHWPSCSSCPVPYGRSQWGGERWALLQGLYSLTILPQRLLCRFIRARASFTFFSLASTKALAKRIP